MVQPDLLDIATRDFSTHNFAPGKIAFLGPEDEPFGIGGINLTLEFLTLVGLD